MMENVVKKRIQEGQVVLGTFLFLPSPGVLEILGRAGFDFVIIDTEHSPIGSLDTVLLENLVRAAEVSGVVPLVRLPEHSRIMAQKALDAGGMGVVVPGIRTAEECLDVVRSTKYPPMGDRGCCYLTRATGYTAMYTEEYWEEANRSTMVVPLIENKEAVENLDAILDLGGIDFAFFGPRDYSMSLGHSTVQNPDTFTARERVERLCKEKGVPLARFLYPPFEESVKRSVDEGARILVAGGDVSLLYGAARGLASAVERLRG
jgi:4-hydroxy-2-oxoheptanedioate aldolase